MMMSRAPERYREGIVSEGTPVAANERPQDGQEPELSKLFAEKTRIERLGRIRQLVFGSLDGLLVPLGVISGVAGGTHDTRAVIVAGIAESFAGALSMGAGEFIASRSEAQVQQAEIRKEQEEIRRNPSFEEREMTHLFAREGVSQEDATEITRLLARYPEAYARTMMEKELGLQMEVPTVRSAEALTMGVSYIIGSIFPLIAYFFFPVLVAFPISLVLTLAALVAVGIIKGRLASLNLARSTLEIVLVGTASAAGGYLLGSVVPHLLGF